MYFLSTSSVLLHDRVCLVKALVYFTKLSYNEGSRLLPGLLGDCFTTASFLSFDGLLKALNGQGYFSHLTFTSQLSIVTNRGLGTV